MNALTLRQIADMAKMPFPSLRIRAWREGWPWATETIINHKPTRLFDPASLPEDIRLKLEAPATTLPAVVTTHPVSAVPEKARRIALARYDLLRHWQEWRTSHPGRAAQADAEFMLGYAHGLCPQIRTLLGEVSIKTLYRWKDLLNGEQDYSLLIPNYYARSRGIEPTLTQLERDLFMGSLLQPSKPKIGSAVRVVAQALQKQNLTLSHSSATFRRYAEQFKAQNYDLWVQMREGNKALRDRVEPYIRRDPSKLEVGDVLVADGHRLNFQVINPFTGKPCRATFVGYLDWKSYHLAGGYIMIEENTRCVAAALRTAIINLGKMPRVCYQDNGRAFRSRFFSGANTSFDECGIDGLFARLGITAVFTHPYNARAKVIEGWWNEFCNTFERLTPSFTGASIADKPAWLARNEKWHKAMHNKYIPTIPEALEMLEQWNEFAGSQPCPYVPGKTRRQVFDEGRGPGVEINHLDDLMLQAKIGYIGNHGIRFLGNDYWSEDLYGLKQRVIVRYSILDLSSIKVYTDKEEFVCVAKHVTQVHPMVCLGTEQDRVDLGREIAIQKRLEQRTITNAEKILQMGSVPFDVPVRTQQPALPAPAKEPLTRELHIPENAVTLKPAISAPTTADGRPLFPDEYQRYMWHKANGCRTDEDKQWCSAFEKSDLYRLLFAGHEA